MTTLSNTYPTSSATGVTSLNGDIYTVSFSTYSIYQNGSSTPLYTFTENYNLHGITTDGTYLYISAYCTNNQYSTSTGTIIKFNPTNNSYTVSVTNLPGPTGICYVNGLLYVSMHNNGVISTFNSSNLSINSSSLITSLSSPQGIVIDTNNNLYIAEGGSNKVSKWSLTGTQLSYSLSIPAPTGLAIKTGSPGSTPYLFVSSNVNNTGDGINQYILSDGSSIGQFANTPSPYGMLFYNETLFYVASYGGNALYEYNYSITCFEKNTKILCLKDNNEVYIKISDLKVGDLVKTYKHGFKKIELVGHDDFKNDPTNPLNCMYKHNKSIENFDNLMVTGGHSLLVDKLSETENKKHQEFRFNYKIEDKTLVLAGLSDDFEQITTNETFTYYHIVLENDNETSNYGIWANGGILTESCRKKAFLQNFKL